MAVAVSEGWKHLDSEDNDDDRQGKHPPMVPWGGAGGQGLKMGARLWLRSLGLEAPSSCY